MISAFSPNLKQSVSFLNILILAVNWSASSSLKAKISKLNLLDSEFFLNWICWIPHWTSLFTSSSTRSNCWFCLDASWICLPFVLAIHLSPKITPFHCGGPTNKFAYLDSTQSQKTWVTQQHQNPISFSFFWQMIQIPSDQPVASSLSFTASY